jgi:putative membrane protein
MTIFHGLGMVIFWAIIVFLFFSLFKSNNEQKKDSALDILKKRLAKGEITKEQFDEIKQTVQ